MGWTEVWKDLEKSLNLGTVAASEINHTRAEFTIGAAIPHGFTGAYPYRPTRGMEYAPAGPTASYVSVSKLAVFPDSRVFVETNNINQNNNLTIVSEKYTRINQSTHKISINNLYYTASDLAQMATRYATNTNTHLDALSIVLDYTARGTNPYAAGVAHASQLPTTGIVENAWSLPSSRIEPIANPNNLPALNGYVVNVLDPYRLPHIYDSIPFDTTDEVLGARHYYERDGSNYGLRFRTYRPDRSVLVDYEYPTHLGY